MGFSFFFFNDTATTEIYTLSLHDALPISGERAGWQARYILGDRRRGADAEPEPRAASRGLIQRRATAGVLAPRSARRINCYRWMATWAVGRVRQRDEHR